MTTRMKRKRMTTMLLLLPMMMMMLMMMTIIIIVVMIRTSIIMMVMSQPSRATPDLLAFWPAAPAGGTRGWPRGRALGLAANERAAALRRLPRMT